MSDPGGVTTTGVASGTGVFSCGLITQTGCLPTPCLAGLCKFNYRVVPGEWGVTVWEVLIASLSTLSLPIDVRKWTEFRTWLPRPIGLCPGQLALC